ncbi:MAG: NDP-sugar synthase [Sphaerochaeta sp.]|nr:NDP-sugar synthase [Sphaerochaeta sp.]
MRAVCDFTRILQLEPQGDSFDHSALFLPLMGKPFLQHVLEYIERLGIREWDIYLSNSADKIEEFIGDGERWGVKLTYHLLKDAGDVSQRIERDAKLLGEEPFLLCNELFLPLLGVGDLSEPQLFHTPEGEDTFWRVCTVSSLATELPIRKVDALRVDGAGTYLESLKKVLTRKGEALIVFGKEMRDGIWVGAGTKIPVSSTLVAPLYLGSQVRIGEGTIIGPFAEIGNGCIIDDNTLVKGSSILAGSFLGRNLDVNGCIVNQNRILHAQLDTLYRATDEMLVTSVKSSEDLVPTVPVPLLSRAVALVLGILTSPVLLLLLVISRKTVKETVVLFPQQAAPSEVRTRRMRVIRTRVQTSGHVWKHFFWHLVPGLWLVVARRARFFGIPYKSVQEFNSISADWQELYLRSVPGIIAEADILYDEYPDDQMLFASEMFYSVMDSRSYNMRLLGSYLKRLVTGKA